MLRFCYDWLHSLMHLGDNQYRRVHAHPDYLWLCHTDWNLHTRLFNNNRAIWWENAWHSGSWDSGTLTTLDTIVLELFPWCASMCFGSVAIMLHLQLDLLLITSGTLSSIDLYPCFVNLNPVISWSSTMSLSRDCIYPMVLTRGMYKLDLFGYHISKH